MVHKKRIEKLIKYYTQNFGYYSDLTKFFLINSSDDPPIAEHNEVISRKILYKNKFIKVFPHEFVFIDHNLNPNSLDSHSPIQYEQPNPIIKKSEWFECNNQFIKIFNSESQFSILRFNQFHNNHNN